MSIIQQYARTLYGIEARIDDDPAKQISAVWERFLGENLAEDCPSRLNDNLIALYCDYEGDHTQPYTFFLGCEVLDVCSAEEGFAIRFTPVGNYAEFNALGDMPNAVLDKWREIWGMDLSRNYAADYEIHDPKSPSRVSIYVGVT